MLIYISHQKAAAIAKKGGVPMPERGEEFLVGRLGNKLGKSLDRLLSTNYYFKIYGDVSARSKGMREFNFK